MAQITNTILMVRPVNFRMNEQTAVNNYYQKSLKATLPATIQAKALEEFDAFVSKLRAKGINVIVVEDTSEPNTPDSIFPNNWISFHADGTVGIYPMFAENRRDERREDVFDILETNGFHINDVVDYTAAEDEEIYLEGTGSLLLDRENKIAYCALSQRAEEDLVIEFCEDFEFTPLLFTANQTVNGERKAIYHTNVMMALAEEFAVVCLASIDDKKERKQLVKQMKASGKEIVNITEAQVENFAGNMLQVIGANNQRFTVMSAAADACLTKDQRAVIEKTSKIVSSSLSTIETCGGGSARCMMAEVFLPNV
ncbi:citrulline utilization hydrolase CtlX [Urechidicola vernalis]|uniref:Arginine deiminase-related protein n=1 Tax=Urechidicola vernalis TaxID=3075600 RepID=A0ABU2Y648_9FLAO|nr:arginine deiminase-related protein [Urechidicola sp. P050]MDT0552730.1 arginine deiminase-related protein [Urechidicola sp. P050]